MVIPSQSDPSPETLLTVIAKKAAIETNSTVLLANVPRFRKRGRINNRKWNAQQPRQSLRQQCLARPGRPDQQDIRLLKLDIGFLA